MDPVPSSTHARVDPDERVRRRSLPVRPARRGRVPQLRVHGTRCRWHRSRRGAPAWPARARPWTIAPDDFTEPVDRLRAGLADLLGVAGDSDGVAITPSVSYGVATAAANLAFDTGQVAVVLHKQFPSDVYGWEVLAERSGGSLHVVDRRPTATGPRPCSQTLDDLGDRVGLVSAPPCHWIDGGRVDLAAVSRRPAASGPPSRSTSASRSVPSRSTSPRSARTSWSAPPTSGCSGRTASGSSGRRRTGAQGVPIEHGWTGRANSHCLACLADYTRSTSPAPGGSTSARWRTSPSSRRPRRRRPDPGVASRGDRRPRATSPIVSPTAPSRSACRWRRRTSDRRTSSGSAVGTDVDAEALAPRARRAPGARQRARRRRAGVGPRVQHARGRRPSGRRARRDDRVSAGVAVPVEPGCAFCGIVAGDGPSARRPRRRRRPRLPRPAAAVPRPRPPRAARPLRDPPRPADRPARGPVPSGAAARLGRRGVDGGEGHVRRHEQPGEPERPAPPRPRRAPDQGRRAAGLLLAADDLRRRCRRRPMSPAASARRGRART